MSFKISSCKKKSCIPFTNGSSGPTKTKLISFSQTKFFIASKSVKEIATLIPQFAVPAFPGAIYKFCNNLLCEIFHAKACSLPPEPKIRTFINQYY